jgi:hypothetical protein
MNRRKYFTAFFVMGLLALFAAFISPNGWTWILCIAALPTMVWACGGKKAPPVLLFILALAWLQIAALVALADLKGLRFDQMEFGPYLERATVYALVAVLTIAVGMRFGGRVGDLIFARSGSSSVQVLHVDPRTDLSRLFIGYAACAAVTGTLAQLAASFAGIAQAILALGALRYAFVYLIAAAVLRFGVGYPWLIAVTVLEIATGILGFFSGLRRSFTSF